MSEVDVIGLEHYDAFYMQRAGQQLLACLTLKQDKRRSGNALATGLARMARIYFTGNCIVSSTMLQLFKSEAVMCKGGFPCNTTTMVPLLCNAKTTASFTAAAATITTTTTTTTTTTCKVLLSASEFRGALQNFLCGEAYDELACDAMKTQGNGLGFRTIHHEGKCVASLYLMRDNVMLMEQPLFGAHAKDVLIERDTIGPSPSLFLLDVTVIRTFMGLSSDAGTLDLAFKECHATGEQRMTLSYHRQHEADSEDSKGNEYIFTATCLLIPMRIS